MTEQDIRDATALFKELLDRWVAVADKHPALMLAFLDVLPRLLMESPRYRETVQK